MSSKTIRVAMFVLGGLSALVAQELARTPNSSPLTVASPPDPDNPDEHQVQPLANHLVALVQAVAPPERLALRSHVLASTQTVQPNRLRITHDGVATQQPSDTLPPLPDAFPPLPPLALPDVPIPNTAIAHLPIESVVTASLKQPAAQAGQVAPSPAKPQSSRQTTPPVSSARQQAASNRQALTPPQPVATQPAVEQPAVEQPVAAKIALAQPAQPLTEKRVTVQPVTGNSTTQAVTAQPPVEPSFPDITTHPSRLAIASLLQRQIIQGFPDGTFRPDAAITDQEFTRMLERAFQRRGDTVATIQRPRDIVTRAQAAELIYQQLQRSETIVRASTPTLVASRTPAGGTVALPETVAIATAGAKALADGAVSPPVAPATPTAAVPSPSLAVNSGRSQSLPVKVAIAGEINRPGFYTLDNTTGDPLPTVTRLLEAAGGMKQTANPSLVQVRRPQRNGTDQTMTVDLWALFKSGDMRQNLLLRDGDKIFVPPAETTSAAIARQQAVAHFAAATVPINIAVMGEVTHPGPYIFGADARRGGNTSGSITPGQGNVNGAWLTVTQAIQQAGGITSQADIRQIQVRRISRAGVPQVVNVNLWEILQAGDLSQDLILQQGDTVTIPKAAALQPTEVVQQQWVSFSPATIQIKVVGEVLKPGVQELPSHTTVNQAVLAAGGLGQQVRKRSVELIRLNPNGTVMRQEITIDIDQGMDAKGDALLRHNDLIVVKPAELTQTTNTIETVMPSMGKFLSFLPMLSLSP